MFRKSMSHGIENGRFLQKWEEKALVGRPVLPCFPLYVSVKSSLTPPKSFYDILHIRENIYTNQVSPSHINRSS